MQISPAVAALFGKACGALEIQRVLEVSPGSIEKDRFKGTSALIGIDYGDGIEIEIRLHMKEDAEKVFSAMRDATVKRLCTALYKVPEDQRLIVFQKLVEFEAR